MTATPARAPHPAPLTAWLAKHDWQDAAAEPLTGGAIATVDRLRRPDGATLVVKHDPAAPPDMFPAEAAGLTTLGDAGHLRVPRVLDAGPEHLVLEDLGPAASTTPADWEVLGRAVAAQHLITAPRFGFATDNYLGRLPQRNTWTDDGHAFFAQHRVLRYLEEPPSETALTADDRRRLDRLAERLPELVPAQPASLLHGDLWHANIVGAAAFDPACHYGWAEAELSMLRCAGGEAVPARFWSAYQEVRPLDDGWADRMELLHLREHISTVAHFGDDYGSVPRIRTILDRWSGA